MEDDDDGRGIQQKGERSVNGHARLYIQRAFSKNKQKHRDNILAVPCKAFVTERDEKYTKGRHGHNHAVGKVTLHLFFYIKKYIL